MRDGGRGRFSFGGVSSSSVGEGARTGTGAEKREFGRKGVWATGAGTGARAGIGAGAGTRLEPEGGGGGEQLQGDSLPKKMTRTGGEGKFAVVCVKPFGLSGEIDEGEQGSAREGEDPRRKSAVGRARGERDEMLRVVNKPFGLLGGIGGGGRGVEAGLQSRPEHRSW